LQQDGKVIPVNFQKILQPGLCADDRGCRNTKQNIMKKSANPSIVCCRLICAMVIANSLMGPRKRTLPFVAVFAVVFFGTTQLVQHATAWVKKAG
jgi:hypothetical protein